MGFFKKVYEKVKEEGREYIGIDFYFWVLKYCVGRRLCLFCNKLCS